MSLSMYQTNNKMFMQNPSDAQNHQINIETKIYEHMLINLVGQNYQPSVQLKSFSMIREKEN